MLIHCVRLKAKKGESGEVKILKLEDYDGSVRRNQAQRLMMCFLLFMHRRTEKVSIISDRRDFTLLAIKVNWASERARRNMTFGSDAGHLKRPNGFFFSVIREFVCHQRLC